MLKIHEFKGFPNPARIRIALAEKGALDQVSFVQVDVPNAEHRSEAYLAFNPSGTVPALELEDGTVISECTAITEYIDHTFAGASLTGTSALERAVVHMMQRRAENQLLDAVADYFHHATDGLGPTVETWQCAPWGQRQSELAVRGMKYFNDVLAQSEYVAGGRFSMADITVYAGLGFADFAKIEIPEQCVALRAWRAKVAARPSASA